MRKILVQLLPFCVLFLTISVSFMIGAAQDDATPWAAWAAKDAAAIGDDNSGSTVAVSQDVTTPEGSETLEVTPSGSSEETKLAVPFTGADLADLATHKQIALDIYLPEDNTLNPNKFFMGMADVTGEFAWVGGIFSDTTDVQPGWNHIVYTLDPAMRQPTADHNYMLFLSFFNADANGNKTPLTEPIYLGGASLSGEEAAATESAPSVETTESAPAAASLVWDAWDAKDAAAIGDDNSGSSVAVNEAILTPEGIASLEVTPSGTSEETKIAVPFSGADLQDLMTYGKVDLEVYLPEGNALNPNKFFMGMADVTGEFAWVAGIFSDEAALQPGWNHIVYTLDPAMRQPVADHNYMLFLSFFNADDNGNKTPLSEPFALGGATLTGAENAPAEATETVWAAWEARNPGMLGDDNTGSNFAASADVDTPSGADALQITPSGTSEETKLAFPVSGQNLQGWASGQVELEIYLPPENSINPNTFFLGMAEITGEWTWVGGIFGQIQGDSGWTRIVFPLDAAMTTPNPNGTYVIYLSSFNTDANGNKAPLTEPFDLGSAYLSAAPAAEATPAPASGANSEDAVYQSEVDILLKMDDEAFLDAVARETFDYFWREANPDNGLVKDRSTPDSPASIAAVGFGLSAIPLAVDRGWISYDRGYERVLTTLQTFANGGVQGEHGFFYHFVNMQTGERVNSSEVSSIDTALLMAGVLTAGEYFKGTEVETLAQQLYENVEWDWMAAGGDTVKMGWSPSGSFITASWDHFDESMILYALSIGSPTHPTPADGWDAWKRPINTANGGYIFLIGEPLFVYQYPLVWLNLHNKEDAYANYWNNTVKACQRNRQFALDNADRYATYGDGVWGISASDGPSGYRAYGAATSNSDGTIAPYASAACLPFTPDEAVASMRAMLSKYGSKVWRDYGFVSAINEDRDWYSTEHIGIDEGDLLLMIANYQDGFVWSLFMQNPNVQQALEAMGFVESTGDYAVTPGYLAQAGR